MPRLVCLYIEDNEAAEAFVREQAEIEGRFITSQQREDGSVISGQMTPVAMFMVPTQYCECPKPEVGSKKIARGTTYGLWVHRDCGKPLPGGWQSPKNLIEHADIKMLNELSPGVHVSWSWNPPHAGLHSLYNK